VGRGREREARVESQFCVSSLCFKTDRVTVKERVELVDRQKAIAWTAIHQELTNFSSLLHQLSSMGYTSDIHEVLERVSGMIPFLKESTKQLSSSSESLGAVRQETRVSDLVSKNIFLIQPPTAKSIQNL